MAHPHEVEEREFSRSVLWDADPDVCCAAFQLGACVHTEGDWNEVYAEELESYSRPTDDEIREDEALVAEWTMDEPF